MRTHPGLEHGRPLFFVCAARGARCQASSRPRAFSGCTTSGAGRLYLPAVHVPAVSLELVFPQVPLVISVPEEFMLPKYQNVLPEV